MKIKIEKGVFLDALKTVTLLPSDKDREITSCLKISVKDSVAEIIAVGDNATIIHSIPEKHLTVKETGAFIVERSSLINGVKKADTDLITLESDMQYLTIKAGKSKVKLNVRDTNLFPNTAVEVVGDEMKISAKSLTESIGKVIYAVAEKEPSRPLLTGINLDIQDTMLRMVATDSYRLATATCPIETAGKDWNVTIPAITLKIVQTVFQEYDNILMHLNEKRAIFQSDHITIVSRLIVGAFPAVLNLIPAKETVGTKVTVDRKRLIEAVERTAIMDEEKKIRITVKQGEDLFVQCKSPEVGLASDLVPAQCTGNDLQIAFTSLYLKDALKALNEQTVTIEMVGEKKPCVIRNEKETHLVLPLICID